jgi:amino acid transporter
MIRAITKISVVLTVLMFTFLPAATFAELPDVRKSAEHAAQGLPGVEEDSNLVVFVGEIVGRLLGVLGIISFIIFLYAGFTWMTAGGDVGKVDNAKKMLSSAVIGLIIITSAYFITSYIVQYLNRPAF